MSTYAIGDIHGCYNTLQALLQKIRFNHYTDKLLLVGDLVNKGRNSIQVLRWAKDLNNNIITVLGNHDLHLLSIYHGSVNNKQYLKMKHIIKASDIDELMLWLSKRPLLHIEKYNVLVHAGIFPTWTIKQAIKYNQLVQQTLTSKNISTLLKIWQNYKNNIWNNTLIGYEKQAMILNIFTKIRTLTKSRQINYNFKDNPSTNTKKLTPWFNNIKYSNKNFFFIFGHWSKLGIVYKKNFVSLDSGCVYGGSLTAIRLEDHQFFSQKILQ